MKIPAFARLAAVLALAGAGAAAWGQAGAPAASDAAAVLPKWAQDKLAAVKADPKAYEQAYRQGAKLASFCANCHGPSGQSVRPDVPNLAGQNTVYVLNQLNKFHDGRRTGAFFMEGLVKAMSPEERFAVAHRNFKRSVKSLESPTQPWVDSRCLPGWLGTGAWAVALSGFGPP
jgi:cytochrome c553